MVSLEVFEFHACHLRVQGNQGLSFQLLNERGLGKSIFAILYCSQPSQAVKIQEKD